MDYFAVVGAFECYGSMGRVPCVGGDGGVCYGVAF